MKNTALKKTTIKVIGGVGIAALSGSLQAASFDCTKAATSVEKMICSNPTVSQLDSELGSAYQVVVKSADNKNEIKRLQRAWLKNERNLCKDVACLIQIYQDRINFLSSIIRAPAISKGFGFGALLMRDAKKHSLNDSFPLKFKLVFGEAYPFCQSYVDMLNKTKYMEYPICERKVLPGYGQFKALVWDVVADEVEIKQTIEGGIKWQHASFKGLDAADYLEAIREFRLQMENIGVSLFKISMDVDRDGVVDTLYKRVLRLRAYENISWCEMNNNFFVFDNSISIFSAEKYKEKGYLGMNFNGNDQLITINNVLYHEHWNLKYGVKNNKEAISIWSISEHKEKICGVNIE